MSIGQSSSLMISSKGYLEALGSPLTTKVTSNPWRESKSASIYREVVTPYPGII